VSAKAIAGGEEYLEVITELSLSDVSCRSVGHSVTLSVPDSSEAYQDS
jgi:hypothetical protein